MSNQAYNCTLFDEVNILTKIMDQNRIFCIIENFQEGTWYNESISNYQFQFGNQTGIRRNLTTQLAYYENSGVIVDLDVNNLADYASKLSDLSIIAGSKDRLSANFLNVHLRAMELSYTVANPITKVFVSNLIVNYKLIIISLQSQIHTICQYLL